MIPNIACGTYLREFRESILFWHGGIFMTFLIIFLIVCVGILISMLVWGREITIWIIDFGLDKKIGFMVRLGRWLQRWL